MHNHNMGKKNSWMMRAMMLCCILPVLIILIIFSFGGKVAGVSTQGILVGIAAMVAIHLLIMRGWHRHSDGGQTAAGKEDKKGKEGKDSETHSGHGCCH